MQKMQSCPKIYKIYKKVITQSPFALCDYFFVDININSIYSWLISIYELVCKSCFLNLPLLRIVWVCYHLVCHVSMDGGLLGFLSFTSLLSSLVKFIGSSLNLLLIVTASGNEELDICHFFWFSCHCYFLPWRRAYIWRFVDKVFSWFLLPWI